MSKFRVILLLGSAFVLAILWGDINSASAQQPRPTPTYDATNVEASSGDKKGTIQGFVFEDVNGDGSCVETGVAGEGPIAGVDIQFVSSDEETIINLQSGPDGRYGLVAAGYSYWGVSARPSSDWVVTSEKTLFVPIYEDSLVATGINFCVQKASAATILLPASGGAGMTPLLGWLLFFGMALFGLGAGWQWRQRFSK